MYRIIDTSCAVAIDLSVVVGLCVASTFPHELLMLPPSALMQLYCCTAVVKVHAAHSEKGHIHERTYNG